MLKNADYIYENVIIADEKNSSKQYCKKAQVGVDLSARNFERITSPGIILYAKSYVSKTEKIPLVYFDTPDGISHLGWHLEKGTYILELNEGCKLDKNDTAYIIMRSSFNRSGCSVNSALWDPGFTTQDGDEVKPMSVRFTVEDKHGIFIEKNARIAQMIVMENEDASLYDGQFQGGRRESKLI